MTLLPRHQQILDEYEEGGYADTAGALAYHEGKPRDYNPHWEARTNAGDQPSAALEWRDGWMIEKIRFEREHAKEKAK